MQKDMPTATLVVGVGEDQLRRDLSSLCRETKSLSQYLLQPASTHCGPTKQQSALTPPSTPSRFTRFVSRHASLKRKGSRHTTTSSNSNFSSKFHKQNKKNKTYDKLDEAPLLARRGSDDSDKTLVDSHDVVESDSGAEYIPAIAAAETNSAFPLTRREPYLGSTLEADKLLSLLAPHISELQRLGARMSSYRSSLVKGSSVQSSLSPGLSILGDSEQDDNNIFRLFKNICDRLLDLMSELKTQPHSESEHEQDHDLEMRDLMISALVKKVEFELDRLPPTDQLRSGLQVSTDNASKLGHDYTLAPPSRPRGSTNPFIVHSASLLAPPVHLPVTTTGTQALDSTNGVDGTGVNVNIDANSNYVRRGSNPIKISLTPSPNPTSVGKQGFSEYEYECEYLAPAQQASTGSGWAKNLVRLGSYQASMLFSNSPVAVRRIGVGVGESGKA
ncbi:hypothetical protein IAU59_006454 [Kwoniella sp. CBS 9459]